MHVSVKIPGAKATGTLQVRSPFTGELVGSVETVGHDAVDQALQTAYGLFRNRKTWLSAQQKSDIFGRVSCLLKERSEYLVDLAVSEGGKPYQDTVAELNRAVDGIDNCRECLRWHHGAEIPMALNSATEHRLAFTHWEPVGPVLALSAFNHPINLIVHQIGPAIAAGCPVILKPAEKCPLSAFALVDIFREAGLPEEWCLPLMTENHAITEALATDSRVAYFSFIGSSDVGWRLRSKLAPGTRCVLEHGGAAPVIVAADADLASALPLLGKGGFYHAGQVCVSVQRVYVEHAVCSRLAEGLSQLSENLVIGDPANPETEVGPLINAEQVDRIDQWLQEALAEGGELLCGGGRLGPTLYRPTVLLNPSDSSKVTVQEVFGPVICIYSCVDINQAVDRANASPFAFQAAVFTHSIDTALYAYKNLRASAVMVNDHTAFRADWMPFAGLSVSGYGTGGIPHTYKSMQIEKLAVFKSSVW